MTKETNVEPLPVSPPTKCGLCGKPVAIHSVESSGWINLVPHDCVKPYEQHVRDENNALEDKARG